LSRTVGSLFMGSALLIGTAIGPVLPVQAATDVGYQDGSYSGSAPTGREPQSKLWFNDGTWWASMYSSSAHAVDIQKLNWSTQTWTDTGVRIDTRSTSLADALWDGTKLYVVSGVSNQSYSCTPPTNGDLSIRLTRYSYNASTKTYSVDAGFPVTIATAAVQAVSLAEDTTGMIWVTWGYPAGGHGNVYLTHSTTDTGHYATPFVLPLSGVTTMECSDYSAIVSYSGKIGIMWSNQIDSDMYFGVHVDGQPDTAWTRNIALSGRGWADNHVNVKSLVADPAGQVFAASKTSLNGDKCPPTSANDGQPLIVLTWMDGNGGWQHRTVSTAHYCWSRPLVQIDADNRQVYVFGTQPAPGSSYGSGGSIMYKQASLDNPNFDSGPGLPFIQLASNPKINNVSGTKQTVNGTTGLVVLAADDSTHRYVHNGISIGPSAPETTITGGPSGRVNTTSASFTFTSSIPGSTFACTLDGGSSTACTSPASYSGLTDGDHTFSVSATANGVTDPSPATRTWTVDTAAPSVTAQAPTDGATNVSRATTVQATFNEAMAAASIGATTFTLFDTTAGAAVPASVSYNGATNVATLTPTTQLAASDQFTATVKGGNGGVTDVAGNPMASDNVWAFTTQAAPLDTTPPVPTLTAPANGATVSGTAVSFTATATDNVAVDHVDFLVNGGVVGSDSTAPYSFSWNSTTVQDGPATITARAVDTSQNQADDTHTVTVSNSSSGTLFSDGFESGNFSLWSAPVLGADGTATVQNQVVKSGSFAAKLTTTATAGSKAYVRSTLPADQTQLTVTEDVQVFAEGTSAQNVPLLRIFDSTGTRIVSLFRQSQSGNKIYIGYGGSNRGTTGLLPLGTWATFSVRIISGSGNATIEVRMNGVVIYSDTAATLPALRTLQIGNDTSAQPMGIYVDNVVATTP
jgi:hypothetical protein